MQKLIEEFNKKDDEKNNDLEFLKLKENNLKVKIKIEGMEKEKKEINIIIEKIRNDNNNLFQENQQLKSNQNEDVLKKQINQLKQNLYKNEKEYWDKYKLLNQEYLNLKKQRYSLEKENLKFKTSYGKN